MVKLLDRVIFSKSSRLSWNNAKDSWNMSGQILDTHARTFTSLLLLCVLIAVEGITDVDSILSVTRFADGDEYLVYTTDHCETKECPKNSTTFVFENCMDDISLRNQCKFLC